MIELIPEGSNFFLTKPYNSSYYYKKRFFSSNISSTVPSKGF